ncbi:hypothetical protein D8X55_01890 [Malacoplasma penetrans]|uniref:Uncharacterized protein n=1 Tax=Malacoplasma penetrans (strain HF-2) TaxID=272633 RepID=Q8EWS7_MALP2|nr:hypothetical protein D8X55_01890 [Malacoplasma penetrans]BAC43917.1 conserved hypothetical protein [Malacoplasma penetrans HF-2]
MEYQNFNNLKNKDKLYKQIYNLFPFQFYSKFKKIILITSIVLFLLIIIYLIVATYLNNPLVWYCCAIPIFFFIFGSLILTTINVEISIKKFKANLYQKQKELTHKDELKIIHLNKKQLFSKRSSFIFNLIDQAWEQLKDQSN